MNIYVGNLNYRVEEQELSNVFGEYGTVSSVKIIKDKYSGKSKGFGFVVMDDDSEANNAIEQLNGFDMGGRALVVNEAKPREEGGQSNNRRRDFNPKYRSRD